MQRRLKYRDTVVPKTGPFQEKVGMISQIFSKKDTIKNISVLFTKYIEESDDIKIAKMYYEEADLILYQPQKQLIRELVPGDAIWINEDMLVWYTVQEMSLAGTKQIFTGYDTSFPNDDQKVYFLKDSYSSLIGSHIDIAKTNRELLSKYTQLKTLPDLPIL